ncbi:MAG: DUF2865 domain-containing protein [Bradyrhizobiaceae bacterium]|nr:DUF2865 domain-containing protein [Bradyrhizobiaceae bacterium]
MTLPRLHLLSRVALVVIAGLALSTHRARAQTGYTPPAPVPQSALPQSAQGPGSNPMCSQLESQLAAVNRGGNDPARADQVKRYEDAVSKQEQELDRMVAQGRRSGCESAGFFSLFSSPNPQCGPINTQISQMRSNLARMQSDLERLQAGGVDSENQRQGILVALAQYNCGPQYRAAAANINNQSGGLFGALFGNTGPFGQGQISNTFRTICVRTCDGYYFPISFATTQDRFQEDLMQCQRMCPAAEVNLYTYHNPGEEVSQAVSINGAPYTALPNAFKYRQEFNPACSCRKPGQTWAQALGQIRDDTVEQGDIIVNEQRAKALSQPKVDAQGRPIRQDARAAKPTLDAPAPAADTSADTTTQNSSASDGKRSIRSVGPVFVPVH